MFYGCICFATCLVVVACQLFARTGGDCIYVLWLASLSVSLCLSPSLPFLFLSEASCPFPLILNLFILQIKSIRSLTLAIAPTRSGEKNNNNRHTGIGDGNRRRVDITEHAADGRDDGHQDRASSTNDDGPEEGGSLAGCPAAVLEGR